MLMFLKVDEVKRTKNRVHLDLPAPDWVAQAERAVSLGAKHLADVDEQGTRWATLLDPEGNEFDIGAGRAEAAASTGTTRPPVAALAM